MSTEEPFRRQRKPEEIQSSVITTGTIQNNKHRYSQGHYSSISESQLPGGVTNTSDVFAPPAGLMSIALYVPAVAVLAVMVRVKLKVVVPGGEEQGLPMM